jgi:hypothetical protein
LRANRDEEEEMVLTWRWRMSRISRRVRFESEVSLKARTIFLMATTLSRSLSRAALLYDRKKERKKERKRERERERERKRESEREKRKIERKDRK